MRNSLKQAHKDLSLYFKWIIIAGAVGAFIGLVSSGFLFAVESATLFRSEHSWIIYLLPIAGIIIVFLYRLSGLPEDPGTNRVLATVHSESNIPLHMAPLIVISTVLTHLCGGSSGREGAALQLGGSIGNLVGNKLHMDMSDKRVLVMCGMAAAFSALLGTPISAVIFALEVASVGVMYYAALLPCTVASITAYIVSLSFGMHPERFEIGLIPTFSTSVASKILLLTALCGGLSIIFCLVMENTAKIQKKLLPNPYVRIVVASLIYIGISLLLKTNDYMGAGIKIIENAIEGHALPYAFILKILLTALILGAGFKGGEIIPTLFVGATFGCTFGIIMNISPQLCAAIGMIAMFCGVTNCPMASLLIAFEMFNYQGQMYFLFAVAGSYLLSGYYGLYHAQTFVYSKYKTVFFKSDENICNNVEQVVSLQKSA